MVAERPRAQVALVVVANLIALTHSQSFFPPSAESLFAAARPVRQSVSLAQFRNPGFAGFQQQRFTVFASPNVAADVVFPTADDGGLNRQRTRQTQQASFSNRRIPVQQQQPKQQQQPQQQQQSSSSFERGFPEFRVQNPQLRPQQQPIQQQQQRQPSVVQPIAPVPTGRLISQRNPAISEIQTNEFHVPEPHGNLQPGFTEETAGPFVELPFSAFGIKPEDYHDSSDSGDDQDYDTEDVDTTPPPVVTTTEKPVQGRVTDEANPGLQEPELTEDGLIKGDPSVNGINFRPFGVVPLKPIHNGWTRETAGNFETLPLSEFFLDEVENTGIKKKKPENEQTQSAPQTTTIRSLQQFNQFASKDDDDFLEPEVTVKPKPLPVVPIRLEHNGYNERTAGKFIELPYSDFFLDDVPNKGYLVTKSPAEKAREATTPDSGSEEITTTPTTGPTAQTVKFTTEQTTTEIPPTTSTTRPQPITTTEQTRDFRPLVFVEQEAPKRVLPTTWDSSLNSIFRKIPDTEPSFFTSPHTTSPSVDSTTDSETTRFLDNDVFSTIGKGLPSVFDSILNEGGPEQATSPAVRNTIDFTTITSSAAEDATEATRGGRTQFQPTSPSSIGRFSPTTSIDLRGFEHGTFSAPGTAEMTGDNPDFPTTWQQAFSHGPKFNFDSTTKRTFGTNKIFSDLAFERHGNGITESSPPSTNSFSPSKSTFRKNPASEEIQPGRFQPTTEPSFIPIIASSDVKGTEFKSAVVKTEARTTTQNNRSFPATPQTTLSHGPDFNSDQTSRTFETNEVATEPNPKDLPKLPKAEVISAHLPRGKETTTEPTIDTTRITRLQTSVNAVSSNIPRKIFRRIQRPRTTIIQVTTPPMNEGFEENTINTDTSSMTTVSPPPTANASTKKITMSKTFTPSAENTQTQSTEDTFTSTHSDDSFPLKSVTFPSFQQALERSRKRLGQGVEKGSEDKSQPVHPDWRANLVPGTNNKLHNFTNVAQTATDNLPQVTANNKDEEIENAVDSASSTQPPRRTWRPATLRRVVPGLRFKARGSGDNSSDSTPTRLFRRPKLSSPQVDSTTTPSVTPTTSAASEPPSRLFRRPITQNVVDVAEGASTEPTSTRGVSRPGVTRPSSSSDTSTVTKSGNLVPGLTRTSLRQFFEQRNRMRTSVLVSSREGVGVAGKKDAKESGSLTEEGSATR